MDWKKIVGTVAPGIATALGGPLAGLAVGALGKALLGDEAAGEDAVAAAVLQANPEALAKVKAAEFEFQARMKELDIDLERIHAADRDSARKREVAVGSWAVNALAFVIVFSAFGIAGSVLFGWAKVESALAGAILGYVFSELKQVTAYFFGSSAGSKAKTAGILGRIKPDS